jgi:sugar phosphate isomerase/epimerase
MSRTTFTRRSFVALAAASPLLAAKKVNLGLELFSVRNELQKDLAATVTAVAKIGYPGVEFFGPYFSWTPERAKEIRGLLNDLGIKCFSTHNGGDAFKPENFQKAIDLNSILGSTHIVAASAPIRAQKLDDWKKVAEILTAASAAFKKAKIRAGYHNHQAEFRELEGTRPIELIAKNTPKDVTLQLDVGTCVEVGQDPVAWINANPGRIRSIHLKEYSKAKAQANPREGYRVLFGEGDAPWKDIFKAAEKKGGVETYLIEQEGAEQPPLEAVKLCLDAYKKIHG